MTQAGSTTYVYDDANRLTSVSGVPYTWDNNDNLLSDGASTYTYDTANRLKTVVQGTTTYGYTYSGLGDRLRQTVNGTPTSYTLDLAAGLTQVLSDGANAYLYGTSRVGEEQPGGWRYHVADSLGSVRQLTDPAGGVALAKSYAPFGSTLSSSGTGTSAFAFAGEQADATGLVYLRARYLSVAQGRFISRDSWEGNPNQPMSYNAWVYGYANPIRNTDPRGRWPIEDDDQDGKPDPYWMCSRIRNPHSRDLCLLAHCAEPILPWRRDPRYDPAQDAIPGWNIAGTDNASQAIRQEHAEVVWKWIEETGGYWGEGLPPIRDLAAWILDREHGATLLNDDVVGRNMRTALEVTREVVQYLNAELGTLPSLPAQEGGIRITDALARLTAFYNPVHSPPYERTVFNRWDWDALTMTRAASVAYQKINDYWHLGAGPYIQYKLVWWVPGESWTGRRNNMDWEREIVDANGNALEYFRRVPR